MCDQLEASSVYVNSDDERTSHLLVNQWHMGFLFNIVTDILTNKLLPSVFLLTNIQTAVHDRVFFNRQQRIASSFTRITPKFSFFNQDFKRNRLFI